MTQDNMGSEVKTGPTPTGQKQMPVSIGYHEDAIFKED
jgi:hypothetical protein